MQLTNNSQTGFGAERRIVPPWAYILAALAFIAAQVLFNVVVAGQSDAPPAWARALLGIMAGLVVGCYLLLIGYVNRDARRRAMSPVLWTLIAVLIPNGLGIILYFLLRQPRPGISPQVHTSLAGDSVVCPRCGYNLKPTCPNCQRVVGLDDSYCRACGTLLLQNQPALGL